MKGIVKKRSIKTTAIGVLSILTAILGIGKSALEGVPPNIEAVSALIAGAGLLFARDNDVTSEDVGAK